MDYWKMVLDYGLIGALVIAISVMAAGKVLPKKAIDEYFKKVEDNHAEKIRLILEEQKISTEKVCKSFDDAIRTFVKTNESNLKAMQQLVKLLKKNGNSK